MTPEQRTRAVVFNSIGPALRTVGLWAKLTSRQTIANRVLDALAKHGLAVTAVCGCGQPVGVCELCDGPRCWRCHPWFTPPLPPCGNCPVCAGRIVGDADCYAASWACEHPPRAAVSASPPTPNLGHPQHPAKPATPTERIAAAIEALCPDPDTEHAGDHCPYREAADTARQIGGAT